MDNSSLIAELHLAASDVSRFNSADWEQLDRERDAASKAWARWRNLKEIAQERGVFNPSDFKGYLV